MSKERKRVNIPTVNKTMLTDFQSIAKKKDLAQTEALRELMCRVVLGELTLTSELHWYCSCDEIGQINVHKSEEDECEHCRQQKGD